MKRKNAPAKVLKALLWPILVLVIAVFFLFSLSNTEKGHSAEGRRQLEESIRRAAVSCYSCEGVYPPNLEYLEENYGVQIDRDRYAVFYDVFAKNLMPDITVVEIND